MLKRIKIVTSLLLVLAVFGLLQLTSGGLFFNAFPGRKSCIGPQERETMLKRIKIVTSLLLVLAVFGLLQLTSGGLFFNALKNDKENFTVLQTIRQQQSTLNGSWVKE